MAEKKTPIIAIAGPRAYLRSRMYGQLSLFPDEDIGSEWEALDTKQLQLDPRTYMSIKDAYHEIFDSFLPGAQSKPFYSQVSHVLEERGVAIGPRVIADLVRRARELGIEDFPDPRARSIRPSSPKAGKLKSPGGAVTMSQEQHHAFASIYRSLLKGGHAKRKKGKGFFSMAAKKMESQGYYFTDKQLSSYAHFRRRIGDINFPKIVGSQEIERMQIVAVDRAQALGIMATGLMHEILQPLQSIRLDAELQEQELGSGKVSNDKLLERARRIVKQVETISTVIQHVRTIARAREPQLNGVQLRPVVENALIIFRQQLQSRGIHVNNQLSDDFPLVRADNVNLERVFVNLFINARDAIEETGRGFGEITVSGHSRESAIICKVSDDGTGILPEILPRIFDPFFTTKEVGKGTGMGLTETMNLMIQFGGKITVDSTPPQGTTFTLEFQEYAK